MKAVDIKILLPIQQPQNERLTNIHTEAEGKISKVTFHSCHIDCTSLIKIKT